MIKTTDEDKHIINAIKTAASDYTLSWAKETKCEDDEVFCENNGVNTAYIASQLEIDINCTRRLLDKLAKRELIHKSKNNAGSYCKWWPVGFLAEIKAN